MKVLSCSKDKSSPSKPEVTSYSGKELETTAPEGVYRSRSVTHPNYIVCKVNNVTNKNVVLWLYDGNVMGSASLYQNNRYIHMPDMSVVLDIKNNKE